MEKNVEKVRLQKYMADNGIASRRKCEQYILEGKVQVNGVTVMELGSKIDPEKEEVSFEGKVIKPLNKNHIYILLNKPIGYVTTVKDQFQRDTVLDLIDIGNRRIVPVGRLDMYTSGALLLSDDGEFVYQLTHPKYEIEKTYVATLKGDVKQEEIDRLEKGIGIEDYVTAPAKVKILKVDIQKKCTRIEITIHEGKNRQVRKMCEAIGKSVLALHRSKVGSLNVKDLKIGTWRYLTKEEVKILLTCIVK